MSDWNHSFNNKNNEWARSLMVNTCHISWKTYICIELQMNSEFSLAFFWWSAKKYCQYSWQLALSWRQKTRRDREIESLDISAKSTNRVNAILAALLLLLQKKENAILLHTLRVIKPTRGVLKRIVIHKIRILCGLLLLMHLFAFLFNKIAHLGTMRYVSCVYLGIYYTSMYLTFFFPWSLAGATEWIS